MRIRTAMLAFAIALIATRAHALDPLEERGIVALEQAYLDLGNDLSVLCVAAHPDDEDNETLAYCRKKLGMRAMTLFATRGEGGQNEIGPQLYRELGVLRSVECERAGMVTGAKPYFLNFIDFGFSKTAEETYKQWGGQDEVVRRLTLALRELKPDVVITHHGFQKDHGNHQAVGESLPIAFERAGDPHWYADAGLAPWTPQRLFVRDREAEKVGLETREEDGSRRGAEAQKIRAIFNVGELDPVRGLTYSEIGLLALRQHRSQGTWARPNEGKGQDLRAYELVKTAGAGGAVSPRDARALNSKKELISGMDRLALPIAPALKGKSRPNSKAVTRAYEESVKLKWETDENSRAGAVLKNRILELGRIYAILNGISLTAKLDDSTIVPGQLVKITYAGFNDGKQPANFSIVAVSSEWMKGNFLLEALGIIPPGDSKTVSVAQDFSSPLDPTGGYTLNQPAALNWYSKNHVAPLLELHSVVRSGDQRADKGFVELPPLAIDGELRRDVEVEAEPSDLPLVLGTGAGSKTDARAELNVRIRNNSLEDLKGVTLRFRDPFTGARRTSRKMDIAANGGVAVADGLFAVAGANVKAGVYPVEAELKSERDWPTGIEAPPSVEARFHAMRVKVAQGLRVGLVETYDDTHAKALRTLGVEFEKLDEAMLRGGDLARFDTILLDLRAYEARPDVREFNGRLLEYVNAGGNMIVMYNKTAEWNLSGGNNYAPYPIVVGRDRVTYEDAPITITNPAHPHLNYPNKITARDFDGWIQERNLYLPASFDAQYQTMIACQDPGEPMHDSGHLTAKYGKGTYTYTCYSWYRQLKNNHEGAFKVFANMLSAGKGR